MLRRRLSHSSVAAPICRQGTAPIPSTGSGQALTFPSGNLCVTPAPLTGEGWGEGERPASASWLPRSRGAWIPAPYRVRGRLFAGITMALPSSPGLTAGPGMDSRLRGNDGLGAPSVYFMVMTVVQRSPQGEGNREALAVGVRCVPEPVSHEVERQHGDDHR